MGRADGVKGREREMKVTVCGQQFAGVSAAIETGHTP